jgi:hypothetical protein
MGFAMAHEENGASSDFMRRAKHDGTTMPSYVQAKILGGGLSTAPKDIKSALLRQFKD